MIFATVTVFGPRARERFRDFPACAQFGHLVAGHLQMQAEPGLVQVTGVARPRLPHQGVIAPRFALL
jgi:hypothetical protein